MLSHVHNSRPYSQPLQNALLFCMYIKYYNIFCISQTKFKFDVLFSRTIHELILKRFKRGNKVAFGNCLVAGNLGFLPVLRILLF